MKIGTYNIGKYTLLGFIMDCFDWLIVGLLPIVGDAIDILSAGFWFMTVGAVGLASAAELIPVVDILPINMMVGFIADQKGGNKK